MRGRILLQCGIAGLCGLLLFSCGNNTPEANIDYSNADLSGSCDLVQLTLSGGNGSGKTSDGISWQVHLLATAPAGNLHTLVALSCTPSAGGQSKLEVAQWGTFDGKPYMMGKPIDFPGIASQFALVNQVTTRGNSLLVWSNRDPGNSYPLQCQASLVFGGRITAVQGPFLLNRVKGNNNCPYGGDPFDANTQIDLVEQLNSTNLDSLGQFSHWGAAQVWKAGNQVMVKPMCSNDSPYQLTSGKLVKQPGGNPPSSDQILLVQLTNPDNQQFFVTTPGASPQGNC